MMMATITAVIVAAQRILQLSIDSSLPHAMVVEHFCMRALLSH
ncbi:hypothetical protein NTE_02827 [Candidatus Nitrososphaera evergladensis SR1]|uniref:Uncharacterized protein n=1 Tax=Candidatus Nitrososphaera evergladensis SR1 TaxID=1459636 RepID=A0A075MW58_9ARCH|nr:hypothetical protein NTE_02827 [Candidatus Nitrososphaera evergladensis SR1]